MSSPMIDGVLLCKKNKQSPKVALSVVAVMMCGRDLATHEELLSFCEGWISENGNPTYKKVLAYVKELGYIREISEISLKLKWKKTI